MKEFVVEATGLKPYNMTWKGSTGYLAVQKIKNRKIEKLHNPKADNVSNRKITFEECKEFW